VYTIKFYITAREEVPVELFIDRLPLTQREKIATKLELLEQFGPNLPRPHADIVRGKIRELRIQFGKIEIRILYSFFKKDYIVLLHAFLKKTRAIKEADISLSERRRVEFLSRMEKGEIEL